MWQEHCACVSCLSVVCKSLKRVVFARHRSTSAGAGLSLAGQSSSRSSGGTSESRGSSITPALARTPTNASPL
eukprot:366142-Chlamydomonas_euryale.AAC.1